MKIAICDDEAFYREHIFMLTKQYANKNKSKQIDISVFTHAEQLVESINKGQSFDIYILDVIMPGMSGIDLGKYLREHGFDGKIVYLTTSDEYAVDSYKVNASDYILKPIKEDVFFTSLNAVVCSTSDKKEKSVLVKAKDRSIKLSLDNILYAELSRRSVIYHLRDGRKIESISIRTNFSDTVKDLSSDPRFIFCGKSLLINMHHITEVRNDTITLDDGVIINAGKKMCRDVRIGWADFCFSEVESK